jgi:hypothetical protein
MYTLGCWTAEDSAMLVSTNKPIANALPQNFIWQNCFEVMRISEAAGDLA